MGSPERELHPDLSPEDRRILFQRGIDLFNAQRFYDCHEAFEEIWRSTTPEPRDLFQGLIQVAVGFYHDLERQRPDVARRVLAKGRRRLELLSSQDLGEFGIDLMGLLASVMAWEHWLETCEVPRPPLPKLRRLAGSSDFDHGS